MAQTDQFAHISLFKGSFLPKERVKKILHLGVPVFIGMVVQNLINITDNVMVGKMAAVSGDQYPHLVNEASNGLAALTPATMFVWLVAGLFSCINVGTQAMVSRRFGEGRFDAAGIVVFNSTTVGLLSGIVIAILGSIYIVPWVFPGLTPNPEVARLGTGYCIIRFYSIPAWVATFGIKAFWDGIGKTHIHMVAAIIMTVMNFILNWVLIFGVDFLGIEPMGVMGAAWGSTCGTYIGFFVVAAWLFKKKYYDKYHYHKVRKWTGHIVGEVYRISLPSGIANIFIMSGFLVFSATAGYLDGGNMLTKLDKNLGPVMAKFTPALLDEIPPEAYAKLTEKQKQELPIQITDLRQKMEELQTVMTPLLDKARASAASNEENILTGIGAVFVESDRSAVSSALDKVIKATPPVLNPHIRPINFNENAAATTVVITIAMFCFIGIFGFGQASATLVGQALGRKEPDIAQKYGFEVVVILMMFYASISALLLIFPEFFIGLVQDDALVGAAAVTPVRIWGVALMLAPAAMILPQCLFAAGHSMYVMIVEIVLHISCLMPISYLFAVTFEGGISGLWLAAGLYVGVLALVMIWKFAGHSWMSSELKG